MTRKWAWAAVAILVAVIIGSLTPRLLTSATLSLPGHIATVVEEPPVSPAGCLLSSCGKQTPTSPAPALAVAGLAATFAAAAFAAISTRRRRRTPISVAALPTGWRMALFHPPRTS